MVIVNGVEVVILDMPGERREQHAEVQPGTQTNDIPSLVR